MKKRFPEVILLLVLSLLLTVGSQTFLRPCVHEDGSPVPCGRIGTGLLLIGIGCVLLGFLLLIRVPKMRAVLFALVCCGGMITALMPGTLMPVCAMDSMRCRMVTRPAALVLGILIAACGLVGLGRELAARKKSGGWI